MPRATSFGRRRVRGAGAANRADSPAADDAARSPDESVAGSSNGEDDANGEGDVNDADGEESLEQSRLGDSGELDDAVMHEDDGDGEETTMRMTKAMPKTKTATPWAMFPAVVCTSPTAHAPCSRSARSRSIRWSMTPGRGRTSPGVATRNGASLPPPLHGFAASTT